jgi:hypothetical protein
MSSSTARGIGAGTIRRSTQAPKESLLLSICGDKLNAEGRSFVRVLIEAERVSVLPQIQTMFEALKDSADGIAKAKIETAFPFAGNELAELTAALEKHFDKKIEATVEVRPGVDRRRARDGGRFGHRRIGPGTTARDGRAAAGVTFEAHGSKRRIR